MVSDRPAAHDLRDRLLEGDPVYGLWFGIGSDSLVEIAALVNWDVVLLDLEHGDYWYDSLPGLIRAAQLGGAEVLVRVASNEPSAIGRVLDAGASGVVVPNVCSLEEALRAVRAARFPQAGNRGIGGGVRASNYGGISPSEFRTSANRCLLALQVESEEGIDVLDDILAVSGVDIVMFGLGDLSQRLGLTEADELRLVEIVDPLVERVLAAGKVVAMWSPDKAGAERWKRRGVQLITVSNATATVRNALAQLRESLP